MTSEKDTAVKPSAASAQSAEVAGGFLAKFGVKVDPDLLARALTHRSWSAENKNAPHNERLEFLGDSVLGFAVTTRLYKMFPKLDEGALTRHRAAVVSTTALAQAARRAGLGEFVRLGKGEAAAGGHDKDSILADTAEAMIGAVFLSTDIETARKFVLDFLAKEFEFIGDLSVMLDPKTALGKIADEMRRPHPQYTVVGEGPDHARRYLATVTLAGVTARAEGRSKKAAEAAAARKAVTRIRAVQAEQQRATVRKNADAGAGAGDVSEKGVPSQGGESVLEPGTEISGATVACSGAGHGTAGA